MTYVDGFVIPLPKRKVAAYVKIAKKASRVWRDHGALDYKECVGDDLRVKTPDGKWATPFRKIAKLKPGEAVVFAYIVYKSRAHRDRVNAKVLKDARMTAMGAEAMPFDMARVCYGGFKTVVE